MDWSLRVFFNHDRDLYIREYHVGHEMKYLFGPRQVSPVSANSYEKFMKTPERNKTLETKRSYEDIKTAVFLAEMYPLNLQWNTVETRETFFFLGKIQERLHCRNSRNRFMYLSFWMLFQANPGYKVQVSFTGNFGIYANDKESCFDWVEIKYKNDVTSAGPRLVLMVETQPIKDPHSPQYSRLLWMLLADM